MNIYENNPYPTDWHSPNWGKIEKVHDWKNYIPDTWKSIWFGLTDREKKMISAISAIQANKEEWD